MLVRYGLRLAITTLLMATTTACWVDATVRHDGGWTAIVRAPRSFCGEYFWPTEYLVSATIDDIAGGECRVELTHPGGTVMLGPVRVATYASSVRVFARLDYLPGADDADAVQGFLANGGEVTVAVETPGRVLSDNSDSHNFAFDRTIRWHTTTEDLRSYEEDSRSSQPLGPDDIITPAGTALYSFSSMRTETTDNLSWPFFLFVGGGAVLLVAGLIAERR